MTAPPAMLALARSLDLGSFSDRLAEAQKCDGSRYHTPTPLLIDRYRYAGGGHVYPITAALQDGDVRLCGTCAENLRVFLQLMVATSGDMPWEAQREFGNSIRRIGKLMWRGMDA